MSSSPVSTQSIVAFNATGTVNSNGINYRTVPSVNDNLPVGQLNRGTAIKISGKLITEDHVNWYQIDMLGGPFWIAAIDITIISDTLRPQSGQGIRLDVPWFSEMSGGNCHSACGEAAVKMVLSYYGKTTPGLREMADHLPHHKWGRYTDSDDLKMLARDYGNITLVELSLQGSTHVLHASLDKKQPVIVLVDYHELQLRNLVENGHVVRWAVVVGYNDTGFFLNDPLWLQANRIGHGQDVFVAEKIFGSALQAASPQFLALAPIQ